MAVFLNSDILNKRFKIYVFYSRWVISTFIHVGKIQLSTAQLKVKYQSSKAFIWIILN